jgi:hypothetical protein
LVYASFESIPIVENELYRKTFFCEWELGEADVAVALELVSAASFVKAGVNDADILGSAAGRMPITGNFLEAVSLASLASSDTLSS